MRRKGTAVNGRAKVSDGMEKHGYEVSCKGMAETRGEKKWQGKAMLRIDPMSKGKDRNRIVAQWLSEDELRMDKQGHGGVSNG